MSSQEQYRVTGVTPNDFANTIAACLDAAQKAGMPLDVVVCIAAGVCADYARMEYGDGYLDDLADIVKARAGEPMPGQAH